MKKRRYWRRFLIRYDLCGVGILPPGAAAHQSLRQHADNADFFNKQVKEFGDVFRLHAGAAHAHLLADAGRVDGAVEAVALIDGAVAHTLPADPVFADGVLGVVAREALACTGVDPRRIDELAVLLDDVVADRGAIAFAQADCVALDEQPVGRIVGRASEEISAVRALVDDSVEGTLDELERLAGAEGVGVADAVDALDEAPVGRKFALASDFDQAVARSDFVAFDQAVTRLDARAEDEVLVDRRELGAESCLVGFARIAV